jgi:uncharacterized membrane protein HdeD (DUF308 family)
MMNNQDESKRIDIGIERIHYTCEDWKWLLTLGVLLALLGTVAIATSVLTTFATVIALGIFLAIGGAIQVIEAIRSRLHDRFFFHTIFGIINIVAGLIMVLKPTIGAASLTLVIAASFMASGLLRIAALFVLKPQHRFLIFLSGLVSFLLGAFIFAQWPLSALWLIGTFIGVDLIFSGWWFIMLAFTIKQKLCSKS